jgi:soluble lytic murein transglycosylase
MSAKPSAGRPTARRLTFWGLCVLLVLWAASPLAPTALQAQGFIPDEPAATPTPAGEPADELESGRPAGAPAPETEPAAGPASDVPYWEVQSQDQQRPYWLPGPEPTPPRPAAAAPAADEAPGLFAPPPPPPPPPPPKPAPAKAAPAAKKAAATEEAVTELTYYMFKDAQGVTHLTDAPSDPRYRMFTVQITVSIGLAPFRRLNLEKVRPLILKAAAAYKLEPALIAAVIKAESSFDPRAVSWVGAQGLMQLMPKTAALVGCQDSFDPDQNVMGGSRYLRMMLNRFNGDVTLAVAAYNSGPERVAKAMAVPEITETKNYVKTVLRNLELFRPLFAEP